MSAAAGYFVLFGFEQAQDLFAEVGWSSDNRKILFFCLALLFWVIAVHFAARLMMTTTAWIPSDEKPRSAGGRQSAGDAVEEEKRAWEDLRRLYRRPGLWIPRLLGILAFVGVLVGLHQTKVNLQPIVESRILPSARNAMDGVDRLETYIWVTLAVFLFLVFVRRPLIEKATGRPAPFLLEGHEVKERNPFKAWVSTWSESKVGALLSFSKWALIIICIGAVLGAMVEPFRLAEGVSRAVFLMLVLGVWVMPLTIVAFLSHRLRAPLIAIGAFAAALISAYVPRVHDIRLLDEPSTGVRQIDLAEAVRRWRAANDCEEPKAVETCPYPIILSAAGGASRAAFFTSTVIGSLLDQTHGGGELREFSQQLFAMSTVSGSSTGAVMARTAIADAMSSGANQDWRRGPCKLRTVDKANRIRWRTELGHFAAQPEDSWRHCLQALTTGDFLSPVAIGLGLRDLLFLPPLLGEGPWWEDRAYLLERAWERHYDLVVGGSSVEHPRDSRLAQPFGIERKLAAKASMPAHPSGEAASGKPKWLPLLVLNGTSVVTGRRILTSDLSPSYQWGEQSNCRQPAKPEPCPIFQESFDLFEMLGSRVGAEPSRPKDDGLLSYLAGFLRPAAYATSCSSPADSVSERAPDIRLSTAATTSARFPLISPSGALRNCAGKVVDRAIDGGYFENGGLFTAADIARALGFFKLKPAILYIANDPTPVVEDPARRTRGNLGPALGMDSGSEFLSDILTPALGLYSTRDGHLAEAARIADAAVSPNFYSVRVYDPLIDRECELRSGQKPDTQCNWSLAKVSMSWWLSQPVQEYLDKQIEKHPSNRKTINRFLGLLRKSCTPSRETDCKGFDEILGYREAARRD